MDDYDVIKDYEDYSDTPESKKESEEYLKWLEDRTSLREANERLLSRKVHPL